MATRGNIPIPPDEKPVVEPEPIVEQRRLLNRWSIFILVFVSASATVLYVSNVIVVNGLSATNDVRRKSIDSLQTLNQSLRSETYKLQSAERITRIATEKLGMTPPQKAPTVLTVTHK
ncbi:MAG: cell division protein FtsL [Ignavibacteria bacterium]|nr:cell division protein FtsL [Ignavibacteria bacterium]